MKSLWPYAQCFLFLCVLILPFLLLLMLKLLVYDNIIYRFHMTVLYVITTCCSVYEIQTHKSCFALLLVCESVKIPMKALCSQGKHCF